MQGIKRNLRYWGYTMESMLLVVLGTFLLISVMTGFNNPGNIYTSVLELISDAGLVYMFLMMCMMAFSGATGNLPFTLAMGSTRKDSFIGMQIMMHLLEIQLVVIVLLANVALGRGNQFGDSIYDTLIVYGTMSFFSVAIGNLIAAVILRFGRGAGFAVYIVLLLLGIFTLSGVLVFDNVSILEILFKGPGALLGIGLDGISIAVYYKIAKKLEVRV